ncbi:ParB N-terminal domain-containing protein [Candidatus Enterovibrio escicola]|uniref:ParB-like N-terminal domain-containing protein n=1 Tax=Candidatus Enterovibrio escicola TaxID=1927127 RepID=A0A2A5T7Q8_9GAMM|nr:ParB N-terminal domain-containing protein [Candidatus Enterovibrio escacola]PCS24213.1 hypothetical protein BTN49_0031 [Candidatus Enterovibrio escacola]
MEKLEHIRLVDLTPDPNQLRKDFDPKKTEELAGIIAAVGIIQPIRVRHNPQTGQGQPTYMIITGERRWQTSKKERKETSLALIVEDKTSLTEEVLFPKYLN